MLLTTFLDLDMRITENLTGQLQGSRITNRKQNALDYKTFIKTYE